MNKDFLELSRWWVARSKITKTIGRVIFCIVAGFFCLHGYRHISNEINSLAVDFLVTLLYSLAVGWPITGLATNEMSERFKLEELNNELNRCNSELEHSQKMLGIANEELAEKNLQLRKSHKQLSDMHQKLELKNTELIESHRLLSATNLELASSKKLIEIANEELRKENRHDELTGLPNRRYIEETARRIEAESRRHECYAFAIMMDLKGFKTVNDTFGHDVGDELLCFVANKLEVLARETDHLARLGGDEFIILGNDFNPEAAINFVQRVLDDEKTWSFEIRDLTIQISASIGYAICVIKGKQTIHDLIKTADSRMYSHKNTGIIHKEP